LLFTFEELFPAQRREWPFLGGKRLILVIRARGHNPVRREGGVGPGQPIDFHIDISQKKGLGGLKPSF